MNLGEAKKRALSVMAEYSVDGALVPDYENTDYLNRMNRFASDAQFEISEKIPIEASKSFDQVGTNESGYNRYEVPDDFKEHRRVMLNDYIFYDYRIENRKLLIKKSFTGTLELLYFKNPKELTENTPDDYEFEVEIQAHSLIPYYMGGMAIADENQTISDRLLNLYFSRLERIIKRNEDYPNFIQNVYSM